MSPHDEVSARRADEILARELEPGVWEKLPEAPPLPGEAFKIRMIGGCAIPIDVATGEPELLQTWWWRDDWRVCVTSLLLVATRRSQVEPKLRWFYDEYPDPEGLIDYYGIAPEPLRSLGLVHQRLMRLHRFSLDYLEGKPIAECYGVGPYVEAAYRLVALKDATAETDDEILLAYRDWLRSLPEDPLRWA